MKKKFSVIQQAGGKHINNMLNNDLHYKILENQLQNINQVFSANTIQTAGDSYEFVPATDEASFDRNIQELATKLGVQLP